MRLRKKLIILGTFFFVATLLFSSSILFYLAKDSIKTSALERERIDLLFRARKFEQSIDSAEQIALILAQTPSITKLFTTKDTSNAEELVALALEDIKQTMRLSPSIRTARIVDSTGQERLKVNRAGSELITVKKENLRNMSQEPFYIASIEAEPFKTSLSHISLYKESDLTDPQRWPALRISTPLTNDTGAATGIVVLTFNARSLLETLIEDTNGTGIVVDQNGTYFIHPHLQKELSPSASLASDRPAIWSVIGSLYKQTYDPENNEYLTWQKIETFSNNQTGALYSISLISENKLFGSINQLGVTFGIVILTVLIITSILCFLASEMLTAPIQELIRGARVIGSGNLQHRLPEKGSSEFKELAYSLNEMAANLESMLIHKNNLTEEIEKRISIQEDLERSRQALLNILEDLKAQRNALLQSEQRFHVALNATPIAIVMINKAGELTFVNSECCRLFNYEADDLIGKAVEVLVPERYRENHPHLRTQFFSNPIRRSIGEARDLFGLKSDGTEFPVELGLNPVIIDSEPYVLSSVVDLTERLQNEQDLRYYAEEMEELLYSVSHDLKTPMVTILGFSKLVQESLAENDVEEARSAAARVVRASYTMERTIRDLLHLNRLSREEVSPTLFNVEDLFDEIQSAVEGDLKEKKIQIQRIISVNEVHGDRRRIEQALLNLFINAIKYGCQSTHGDTIWIGVEEDSRVYRFFVRDLGPGIALKDQSRIFQQFKRLQLDQNGTGLGLTIVSKCAKLLGGKAWVESSPGEGSTFWFSVKKIRSSISIPTRSSDIEIQH